MKRFCILPVVLSLLAALLAIPVYAAGTSYVFEVRPSVSFLPDFETLGNGYPSATFPGFVPAGTYEVYVLANNDETSEGAVLSFTDTIELSYEPLAEYYGFLGTRAYVTGSLDGVDVSFWYAVVYFAEEGETFFCIELDESVFELFDLGTQITMTLVDDQGQSQQLYLKDRIVDLFGPYEQQTETITTTFADGSTVTVEQRIPGIAGLDYEWFAALCLFGLMLYCFFRLLGGVFK